MTTIQIKYIADKKPSRVTIKEYQGVPEMIAFSIETLLNYLVKDSSNGVACERNEE